MLLEQLKELVAFQLVQKNVFEGYPLKVEYSLTERGKKLLSAIKIMQEIGVDYMVDLHLEHILDEKGIAY
nr:winged helix-turn-helix transcriptional regulator [Streptococcus orisasini]